MVFKNVQFIGMSICCTPSNLNSIEETSDNGYYSGYANDMEDLTARVKIIEQAIKATFSNSSVAKSSDTLKVFVIPEFFMRGALGAYNTSSWVFPMEYELIKLFNESITTLKSIGLAIDSSCLFVLGTILSTCDPIDKTSEPTKSLYQTGDNLLDIYYRLYPNDFSKDNGVTGYNSNMHNFLKLLDEKEIDMLYGTNHNDIPYIDILKKTLDYCDAHSTIDIYNRCLILTGDPEKNRNLGEFNLSDNLAIPKQPYGAYVVQKQFKSKEDFILNNRNNDMVTKTDKYIQSITKYPVIDNSTGEQKKAPEDGLGIFNYENVVLGVDICLDHSRQRLLKHLEAYPSDYVDIQIIPSCGMSIRANAVIARNGGYVFNCDGEYVLGPGQGINGIDSHTSLQKVRSQYTKDKGSAILEAAQGVVSNIKLKTNTGDGVLFPHADYNLHIYKVQELPKK